MLRSVSVSIPITPRGTPKLGLLLIPFIADVLSKKMGIDNVLALNVIGSKLYGDDVESHVAGYLRASHALGIKLSHIWRDDQKENIYWTNLFFQQLMADGYIVRDRQILSRCPCRAVETLAIAENFSTTRKLYARVDDIDRCKVCGGPVRSEEDIVYLFEIPAVPVIWHITPSFSKTEIVNLEKRFAGTRILISKTRSSAIPLWTGKEHIFLDVDFGWQLFLPILRRFGYQPLVLVGSQKNLFGSYLTLLLSYLIDKTMPELVVPGYCITKDKVDEQALSVFSEWDKVVTRMFMGCHCTFRKKEMVFSPSLLRLIERVIGQVDQSIQYSSRQLPLCDAISECEGHIIRRLFVSGKSRGRIADDVLRGLL